jgi:signal transduction histidine kinase
MGVHVDQAPSCRPGSPDDSGRVLQLIPRGSAPAIEFATRTSLPVDVARSAGLDHAVAIERMADATMRLARRNEALEDFAALVAHELKSPLEAALLAEDPHRWIASALDLVESLLQAATDSPDGAWASLTDCLAQAACCLHPHQLTVAADDAARFPLPPESLSVILRNLLANAAAAKARRVDVFTTQQQDQWTLVVEDDGVGLGARGHEYDHGSGIGLELCRRIAARNGARLELLPRHAGGTRAILTMEPAA